MDQYNATALFQQSTVFSGLGNGSHTIVIVSNKTKNAASSGLVVYHDCFIAPTDSHCTALMGANYHMENNYDGSTTYTWGTTTFASASGGSFSSVKSNTAATALTFAGTSITWKYLKGPAAGIARVIIDGTQVGTVDQYAAAPTTASVNYPGLTGGGALHTIFITGTGSKNTASTGTWIYSDAFVVRLHHGRELGKEKKER